MKNCKLMIVAAGMLALVAAPALAYEDGTWILRAGVGTVQTLKDSNLTFTDEDGTFKLDVDGATSLTLDATYMFNQNWAFDILAALPFKHDINVTADMGSETFSAKIAETKQLPPTFSIRYYFLPEGDFMPYVGLGVNWTTFSSSKLVSDLDEEDIGLSIDDSFGVAAQIGSDWIIGEKTVLNLDIRWIDLDADAYLTSSEFPGGKEKLGTIEVDPWFVALNIGYYF